jgi:integrase/recombinase XerD
MFLLSCDAALRAKEIALLEWSMLTDATGALTDEIRAGLANSDSSLSGFSA